MYCQFISYHNDVLKLIFHGASCLFFAIMTTLSIFFLSCRIFAFFLIFINYLWLYLPNPQFVFLSLCLLSSTIYYLLHSNLWFYPQSFFYLFIFISYFLLLFFHLSLLAYSARWDITWSCSLFRTIFVDFG